MDGKQTVRLDQNSSSIELVTTKGDDGQESSSQEDGLYLSHSIKARYNYDGYIIGDSIRESVQFRAEKNDFVVSPQSLDGTDWKLSDRRR